MLPFVLLDNALKFTPEDQSIEVTFEEGANRLAVYIRSFGPVLLPGEEERISNEGYRGENARRKSGSGLGLSLAAQICEVHHISIRFRSDPSKFSVDGIPYGIFEVGLIFDPETLVPAIEADRLL